MSLVYKMIKRHDVEQEREDLEDISEVVRGPIERKTVLADDQEFIASPAERKTDGSMHTFSPKGLWLLGGVALGLVVLADPIGAFSGKGTEPSHSVMMRAAQAEPASQSFQTASLSPKKSFSSRFESDNRVGASSRTSSNEANEPVQSSGTTDASGSGRPTAASLDSGASEESASAQSEHSERVVHKGNKGGHAEGYSKDQVTLASHEKSPAAASVASPFGYTVEVGSFADESAARTLIDAYRKRNIFSYIIEMRDDPAKRFRVCIGRFATDKQAEGLVAAFREREGVAAHVLPMSDTAPGLKRMLKTRTMMRADNATRRGSAKREVMANFRPSVSSRSTSGKKSVSKQDRPSKPMHVASLVGGKSSSRQQRQKISLSSLRKKSDQAGAVALASNRTAHPSTENRASTVKPAPAIVQGQPAVAQDDLPFHYAVQVGAFRSRGKADKSASRFTRKGYKPYVVLTYGKNDTPWHSVYLGRFNRGAEGRNKVAALKAKGIDAIMVSLKSYSPELRQRMQAASAFLLAESPTRQVASVPAKQIATSPKVIKHVEPVVVKKPVQIKRHGIPVTVAAAKPVLPPLTKKEAERLFRKIYRDRIQKKPIANLDEKLTRILAAKPGHRGASWLLARNMVDRGEIQQALTILEQVKREREPKELAKSDPKMAELMAALYQRSGRHWDAIDLYEALVKSDLEKGIWWMGMGISLERVDEHKDALVAYEKALKQGDLNRQLRHFVKNRIRTL